MRRKIEEVEATLEAQVLGLKLLIYEALSY
jgi:hypothetical protein